MKYTIRFPRVVRQLSLVGILVLFTACGALNPAEPTPDPLPSIAPLGAGQVELTREQKKRSAEVEAETAWHISRIKARLSTPTPSAEEAVNADTASLVPGLPASADREGWTVYMDSQNGYSIEAAPDWNTEVGGPDSLVITDSEGNAVLSVFRGERTGYTLDRLTDETLEFRRREAKSLFEMGESPQVVLASGMLGSSLVYWSRQADSDCVMQNIEIALMIGSQAFTMHGSACQDQFDAYASDLVSMMDTFDATLVGISPTSAPPHVFVGNAYIDGEPASDGTRVTAWVDGALTGSSAVFGGDGGYGPLFVSQIDSRSLAGKEIAFVLGDRVVDQTAFWIQGSAGELNLRID